MEEPIDGDGVMGEVFELGRVIETLMWPRKTLKKFCKLSPFL